MQTQYETKILSLTELHEFPLRDLRPQVLEQIEQRIREHGYNPARPLSVVMKDGQYVVADGNHRLFVLRKLQITEVPCIIFNDGADVYKIAVDGNRDEDTYAPMDLFDWLSIIRHLKDEGYSQKDIASILGIGGQSRVSQLMQVGDKVTTKMLDLAKSHQTGRVILDITNVIFDFSEGWFRDSGLYGLEEQYQEQLMDAFIADKCNWKKQKVQTESVKYAQWQDFIKIAGDKLQDAAKMPLIIDLVEAGTFKNEGQLMAKVNELNREASNKLICGDAITELESVEDISIDIAIFDQPYGMEYESNHSIYKDFVTKDGITNDDLQTALDLLDKTCEILTRKMKKDCHLYIFTSWKGYPAFAAIVSKYFAVKNLIVWDKGNWSMGDLEGSWGNQYELILFASHGQKKLNMRHGDILSVPRVPSTQAIHPTQKPVDLITELLKVSAQSADVICDPFMGSGSTIKAVKQFGKDLRYIGIELDSTIFEKAKAFIGGK